MESEEDPAPSSKRRQLADPRLRTQTHSYLSLICSNDVPSTPHGRNDGFTTIYEAKAPAAQDPPSIASCASDNVGANSDEAECPQCCYGMVREEAIASKQHSSRSLAGIILAIRYPNKVHRCL
jgi:hypothetical protein